MLSHKNECFLIGSEEACQDQMNVLQMCFDDQENNQCFHNQTLSREIERCRNSGTC